MTVMLDNVREHNVSLEERKFEVNKLQVVCEAQAAQIIWEEAELQFSLTVNGYGSKLGTPNSWMVLSY